MSIFFAQGLRKQPTIMKGPKAGGRPLGPFASFPPFAGLVTFAERSDPIPSRTRPSNALAPMVLGLKTWESRPLPGLRRAESSFFSLLSHMNGGLRQAKAAVCLWRG